MSLSLSHVCSPLPTSMSATLTNGMTRLCKHGRRFHLCCPPQSRTLKQEKKQAHRAPRSDAPQSELFCLSSVSFYPLFSVVACLFVSAEQRLWLFPRSLSALTSSTSTHRPPLCTSAFCCFWFSIFDFPPPISTLFFHLFFCCRRILTLISFFVSAFLALHCMCVSKRGGET